MDHFEIEPAIGQIRNLIHGLLEEVLGIVDWLAIWLSALPELLEPLQLLQL